MDDVYRPESGLMPQDGQQIRIAILPREVRLKIRKFLGKGPTFALDQVPQDGRDAVLEFFSRRQSELSSTRRARPQAAGPVSAPRPDILE